MTTGTAALGGLINCHYILFPHFNELRGNNLHLHLPRTKEPKLPAGRSLSLEAGFLKNLEPELKCKVSGLILMRQEAENQLESAWITGKRGEMDLFFWQGLCVYHVLFVSHF